MQKSLKLSSRKLIFQICSLSCKYSIELQDFWQLMIRTYLLLFLVLVCLEKNAKKFMLHCLLIFLRWKFEMIVNLKTNHQSVDSLQNKNFQIYSNTRRKFSKSFHLKFMAFLQLSSLPNEWWLSMNLKSLTSIKPYTSAWSAFWAIHLFKQNHLSLLSLQRSVFCRLKRNPWRRSFHSTRSINGTFHSNRIRMKLFKKKPNTNTWSFGQSSNESFLIKLNS